MKEVTYEIWKENPTPREMLVWDDDFEEATKKFVIYILPKENFNFNVIALDNYSNVAFAYEHCAEIEKTRLMTKQELAWWLRKNPTREFTTDYTRAGANVHNGYTYCMCDANKPVEDYIMVRENGLAWREPSSDLLD